MDIITAATNWAKGEITSSLFFMLFGICYLVVAYVLTTIMGASQLTKALIVPMLIAGGLLVMAGMSFYFSNKSKLKNFESDYKANPTAVVKSELANTAKTMKTYENVALKVFPAIIFIAVLISIFVDTPMVRAISIAVIAFLAVLVLLDSQALKRMKIYHEQLEQVEK